MSEVNVATTALVEVSLFMCLAFAVKTVIQEKKQITVQNDQTAHLNHTHYPINMRPFEHEKRMNARLSINDADDVESIERNKVVVKVPATSANLGPGFDTIGLAVDMWSEISAERSDQFQIVNLGEGCTDIPVDKTNLVYVGLEAAFRAAGKPIPPLKVTCTHRIPYARGLGSSSAAIVGGLVAGLVLAGHQVPAWGSEELLNLACEIEGHPDNVAPAIYGGIQLGIHTGKRWISERVNVPPGLQCVVFIPETVGKTVTARAVLSETVTRKEAVFNLGRVAWLINALTSNNLEQLRYGMEDALHQPQRGEHMYPHLAPVMKAAIDAGASASYLSGAGPSVMALSSGASGDIFTQRHKERVDRKVAAAMLAAAEACGTKGRVYITGPVDIGAVVVSADPPFSQGLVQYRGGV